MENGVRAVPVGQAAECAELLLATREFMWERCEFPKRGISPSLGSLVDTGIQL